MTILRGEVVVEDGKLFGTKEQRLSCYRVRLTGG